MPITDSAMDYQYLLSHEAQNAGWNSSLEAPIWVGT